MFDKLPDSSVLFWSGGLDSTLILAALREQNETFDIYQARDMWTKEQKKRADDLIKKWDLQVYSYPSASRFVIGNEKELSVVFEYAIGTQLLPYIRDVVDGTACMADLGKIPTVHVAPIMWDLHIIGSRKDDDHWATGSPIPSERFQIDGNKFYAPLYNWSRSQVKEALAQYGLDNEEIADELDTGNLVACSKCLQGNERVFCPKEGKMIDSIIWSRSENTNVFRKKYNFNTK